MKIHIMKTKLLGLLIGLLVLSACGEDSLLPNKMTAKIDGEEWKAITRNATLSGETFIISGISTDGRSVVLTIRGATEGTYNLAFSTGSVSGECAAAFVPIGIDSETSENAYGSVQGSVTISNIDKTNNKISGIFNFKMVKNSEITNLTDLLSVDVLEITEGEFNDLLYVEI